MRAVATTAAFLVDGRLHAVRYVKINALGWCGAAGAEGESAAIYYVPSWAFDGRAMHDDVGVCMKCSAALCVLAEPR